MGRQAEARSVPGVGRDDSSLAGLRSLVAP